MARPKGSKNPNAGRKPLWSTPEELQKQIDAFWVFIEKNKRPATIERLACFLECEKETILNYQKKDKFFGTIKKAKDKILAEKVERLNSGMPATGIIFDLKNNHGWKDKTEQDVNVNGDLTISVVKFV